jgi:hypothetical protein
VRGEGEGACMSREQALEGKGPLRRPVVSM